MDDNSLVNSSSRIRQFWNRFIDSDTHSYQRGEWLDLFLAELLLQLHDAKSTPLEVLSFGISVSQIAETLSKEIIREIRRVSCHHSVSNSDYNDGKVDKEQNLPVSLIADEEGSEEAVRHYLLLDKGWRCLSVLHTLLPLISQDTVGWGEELAILLMSLYPLLGCSTEGKEQEAEKKSVNHYIVYQPSLDIEKVCCFKLATKLKSRSSISHSFGVEGSPPVQFISSPTRKISSSSLTKRSQKQNMLEKLLKSSESDDNINEIIHKQSAIKMRFNPMDFDYFTNIVRSEGDLLFRKEDSCHFYRHHSSGSVKKKPNPIDMRDERLLTVLRQATNVKELKLLIVELLQDLCLAVSDSTKDHSVSLKTMTFSLENLWNIQFESEIENSFKNSELIKLAITKLFLLSLFNVLRNAELLKEAMQKGLLTMMLRLTEFTVSKFNSAGEQLALKDFIFAIVYAVTCTIHGLILQLPVPNFLPYFKLFIDSFTGKWVINVLPQILEGRAKTIVGQLGHIITSLKNVRIKIVHQRLCKKVRHKNCEYTTKSWHHDDILGCSYTTSNVLKEENNYCAVSCVFMILTRFLTEVTKPEIALRILHAMEQCGTCCCFPASPLVTRLTKLMQTSFREDKKCVLLVLEKTVYREIGAVSEFDGNEVLCSACQHSNDNSGKQWSWLEAFKHLLLSPDPDLTSVVASHLLSIAPHCSLTFQKKMLFTVFYPAFRIFKKKYECHRLEKDKNGTIACLSAFTHLLGKVRFAEEFVEQEGASENILELLKFPEFSTLSITVVQTAIIVKLWKLEKSNCPNVLDEGIKELQTLVNCVEDSIKCFLTTIKKLQGCFKEDSGNYPIVFRKEIEWDSYIGMLEELRLYWKSWMDLCLLSPQIRAYFTRHLSIKCYTLLVMFLQHIVRSISIEAEGVNDIQEKLSYSYRLHLTILEALIVLSVIAPYAGNPGGVFDLKSKLEKVVESKIGLRPICDVLLRSSGANPSQNIMFPTYPVPQVFCMENSTNRSADGAISDTTYSGSADEGYDGDIETQCNKSDGEEVSCVDSLPPSRKISWNRENERRFHKIVHPSLCHIALHLIHHCYKLNLCLKDCVYGMNKFSSHLRDKQDNCICLARTGFTHFILKNFSLLLSMKTTDTDVSELQQAILEVFGYLSRYSLQLQELAQFMKCFTQDDPPLELLLGCLLKLLKYFVPQPKSCICFPSPYVNCDVVKASAAHKLATIVHNQHKSIGSKSCWSRAAIFLPLSAELGWAMWVQGFSLALWIKMSPSMNERKSYGHDIEVCTEKTEGDFVPVVDSNFNVFEMLHIISIGYEALVLEFWADTNKELLHVRLVRSDGGVIHILSQATVAQGVFTSKTWHHLSISVRDSIHSGIVIIQVTAIIDGKHEVQVPLTFKGLLVRKARATCVLLGDTVEGSGQWQTAGLVMWRQPVLDKSAAQWLTSLGPADTHATLLQATSEQLVFRLQESLLFVYCSQIPGTMNIYQQNIPGSGGVFKSVKDSEKHQDLLREVSIVTVPAVVQVVMACHPVQDFYSTITSALDSFGGLPVFLFLFARVVEMKQGRSEADEKCRALALEVYLRLVKCESFFEAEAKQRSYAQLVAWVLQAGPYPGQHVLNVILETCCSKCDDGKEDRVVTDAGTLVDLTLGRMSSSCWLVDQSRPLAALFRFLLELLKDDHPNREQNAFLLNQANLLDAILNFCKDNVMEDGCPNGISNDKEMCCSLVEVMRGIMTAPPRLDHLALIADYLLLSHPAHTTYISHSRTSLYFVLPPRPPSITSGKPRSRKMKLSVFRRAEKNLPGSEDEKEYQHLFAQPVDPKQLNKALTNLQIRGGCSEDLNMSRSSVEGESSSPWLQSYYANDDEFQEEACDSGIACGSYRNNISSNGENLDLQQTDFDDSVSGISANTYFISDPSFPHNLDDVDIKRNSSVNSDDDEIAHDNGFQNLTEIDVEMNTSKKDNFIGGYEAFRCGLFELLRDQLLMTPDSTLKLLFRPIGILSPECFVVMANHHNTNITASAVKVLEAYWERADSTEKSRFCKDKGFYLLAIQLSSQEKLRASPQLADILAGFITGCHRQPMALQLDTSDHVGKSSTFNFSALPPLLALLPRTVSNLPLAHNIVTFLYALFMKATDWKNILQYGLVEAVLKSIVALIHHSSCRNENMLLITDLHNLLSTVISALLHSSGTSSVHAWLDVLLQIEYVFLIETNSCGVLSDCSLMLRRTQALILQSSLKTILEVIASSSFPSASSFLSSVPVQFMKWRNNSEKVMSSSTEDVESTNSSMSSLFIQGSKLSKSDLNERFKAVMTQCVHFATYAEPLSDNVIQAVESEFEGEFVREVWKHIILSVVTIIERKSMPHCSFSNVVNDNSYAVRCLSSQMFLWLLSPNHSKTLRMFAIQSIYNEPRFKDILCYILSSSQIEETCALFVRNLLEEGELYDNERKTCLEFCCRLEESCTPSVFNIINTGHFASTRSTYLEDLKSTNNEAIRTRTSWRTKHLKNIKKCVYKREPLAVNILEQSLHVTAEIVVRQSELRKQQMETIKAGYMAKANALFKWRSIVKAHTHERALWHFPKSYPKSWQLDPTEGPSRVRKRLQRCHIDMDEQFLKPECVHKLKKFNAKEPLTYLFEGTSSMTDVLVDKLHSNTKVRHMCPANVIIPSRELPGELLIGEKALYFVPGSYHTSLACVGDIDSIASEEWPFECIKELHKRRYELQERAIEIFLLNGKTYLLAFQSTKDRDDMMSALLECELGSRVSSEPLNDAVDLWREGHLTNWQYLATLNTLAGRSYNDLMQYPVLPFVLADYTNTVLDLTNPSSFRNFKKPMAIQDKKNEQYYINNYNYWKSEIPDNKNISAALTGDNDERQQRQPLEQPHHYSSHYSNSGIVLQFLVRLPPFTSMFLCYQDNRFDWPDRTFHSLHTTWRLASSESTSDVKELIPEFFYLPEFLTNYEGFNFGYRQNGETVDNVVLPQWAKDPRTFVLIHRQALESDHIREELPHWIDLVFGYKQVGKAAVDSINVFHPATYYGYDVDSIADPLVLNARKTMVRTYGQTPKQLFRTPHRMAVESLLPAYYQPQVLPSVKGLKWGRYVGSPAEGPPVVVWQHWHQSVVASLVPLLTNDVFGLAPSTALLLSYTKETPLSLMVYGGTCVLGAALISWGHGDGVIRAKLRKDQPPFAILGPSAATSLLDVFPLFGTGEEESIGPKTLCQNSAGISLCASAPDSNQLWIAYISGKLLVYTFKFDGTGGCLELARDPVSLVGHRSSVLAVALSRSFSTAVSCDRSGIVIVWDMNTLSYIRSLPEVTTPITLACISDTLGDIATVCDGTCLRVHTINGELVGNITMESPLSITAVCFSTAPEGTSVNVVAAGISDSTIRLWSTWDLSLVGKILMPGGEISPIICLTYSHDSHQLYASTEDGLVVIWESRRAVNGAGSSSQQSSSQHKFLNLSSLQ